MEHRCTLKVRSYECDSYGHVNNAVYLNYLEFARHEYLKHIALSLDELRNAGFAMLVAEIRIRYRIPALTDQTLHIVTTPVKRSRLSGVLEQTILRDAQTVAHAEVKWVCVDKEGRPAPLPERFNKEGLGGNG